MKVDWFKIPKKFLDESIASGISQSESYIYIYSKKTDTIIRVRKEQRNNYTKKEIKQLILNSKHIDIVAKQVSDTSTVAYLKKEG